MPVKKRKPRSKVSQKQSQRQSVVVNINNQQRNQKPRRKRQPSKAQEEKRPASNNIIVQPSLAVQSYPMMYSPQYETARPNVLVPPAVPLKSEVPVKTMGSIDTKLFADAGINTDEPVFSSSTPIIKDEVVSTPDVKVPFEKVAMSKDMDNEALLDRSSLNMARLFEKEPAEIEEENELLRQTNYAKKGAAQSPYQNLYEVYGDDNDDDTLVPEFTNALYEKSSVSIKKLVNMYNKKKLPEIQDMAQGAGIELYFVDAQGKKKKKTKPQLIHEYLSATGGGKEDKDEYDV